MLEGQYPLFVRNLQKLSTLLFARLTADAKFVKPLITDGVYPPNLTSFTVMQLNSVPDIFDWNAKTPD